MKIQNGKIINIYFSDFIACDCDSKYSTSDRHQVQFNLADNRIIGINEKAIRWFAEELQLVYNKSCAYLVTHQVSNQSEV